MKTNDIITSLRQCNISVPGHCKNCPVYSQSSGCLDVLHKEAADALEAQQKRIEELEAELKDERHRHDRYVDFELAQAKELEQLRAERRWIPVTERLPETDLTGKCGSCAFAAPAPGSFGRSTCYVRCTNKEHLQIYCRKHHSSGLRQRTVKACKRYKPKEV